MARTLRIEYPGAVYHVMSLGNQDGLSFQGDPDRKLFLETVAEVCEKTGWTIHAYVLAPNHSHLLVETPGGNLVAGMKWLEKAVAGKARPSRAGEARRAHDETGAGALLVGLFAITCFDTRPEQAAPAHADSETVLAALARVLFNPWIVGAVTNRDDAIHGFDGIGSTA